MYAIDSNVFIEAKNRHYGFDFCPAFWDWLDEAHAAGRVLSVAAIRDELKGGEDELAAWAMQREGFFVEPDDDTLASLKELAAWATTAGYADAAVSEFAGNGDYFLIGHSDAHGLTVVTHEVASPESKRKIKIPDACASMGVPCLNPFEMLKAEGAKFVLGE
jgi:Domain of unknown function (DUF4411)